jgi:hypothetical protein
VEVRLEGQGRIHAFWQAEGVPKDGPVKEEDSGLSIRRVFLERDGKPADPNALEQGKLYHVQWTIRTDHAVSNMVIADLLPAGVEIEDPNLRGAADAKEPEGGPYRIGPERIERRDDRILVFAHIPEGASEYRYAVRAVTSGTFTLPAVEASCMYDPGLFSVNGRGTVTVKSR